MLPIPTQFNYADFLGLKDFLHRLPSFAAEWDDSCFPKLILPLLSPQLWREAIRRRQVRGVGRESSPCRFLGDGDSWKKAQSPFAWHKRDQGLLGGLTQEGSHSSIFLSLIQTGCGRLCPRVPQAGQQHQGEAHAAGQLSCVPVTPFCHWDASAANARANYLLAMAPLRIHHVTHDGKETSPYPYFITTWIAHTSLV